jgi:transcriptional regulator with XRE-family HTH domain
MVNSRARASYAEVPSRLRELRRAREIPTAAAFAEILDATPARYGNIEAGSHNLSIKVAHAIVDAVSGMTLDWLYYGREGGLDLPLRDSLRAAREEIASEARRLPPR